MNYALVYIAFLLRKGKKLKDNLGHLDFLHS